MDRFLIEGPVRLRGEVRCSGAKNAVLPLMAAALLSRGESRIDNVPDLRDVRTFMRLLDILGARCDLTDGRLTIDAAGVSGCEAPYDLVKTMRASVYVLGPLTAFGGEARVSLPGGCAWGPRPVNLHLSGLESLGAEVELDSGYISTRSPGDGLRGGSFRFEPCSVGATCNVLMAAVLARGNSELTNCAVEPEVTQLGKALVAAGARIDGLGTTTLRIQGVAELEPLRTAVIPDRIEAGTFLAGAAMTRGDVTVTHCDPVHLEAVTAALDAMGCKVTVGDGRVRVEGPDRLRPVEIVTRPYPAFATDMQAQLMACACLADGTSHLTETIYPDRFTHAAELRRLGADIRLDGATATVFGAGDLQGAPVMATDLRASAALVLAGCAAAGVTTVDRVYHIDRGYEHIEQKLAGLGGRIRREKA